MESVSRRVYCEVAQKLTSTAWVQMLTGQLLPVYISQRPSRPLQIFVATQKTQNTYVRFATDCTTAPLGEIRGEGLEAIVALGPVAAGLRRMVEEEDAEAMEAISNSSPQIDVSQGTIALLLL
jgi:hypothetical protein